MTKKQVVVIHGGRTFKNHQQYLDSLKYREVEVADFTLHKDWKDTLQETLGSNFEVFNPRMPSANNAVYEEWRIWFERMTPFLGDNVVLIGHSLGGIFLAKYLSENTFKKSIEKVLLVAPPFDDHDLDEPLGGFRLPTSLELVVSQVKEIYILFSKDDPVVGFSHLEKYKHALPSCKEVVFEDRQHFNQESFPELIELVKR